VCVGAPQIGKRLQQLIAWADADSSRPSAALAADSAIHCSGCHPCCMH
jgi:hypothetical protein